MKISPNLPTRSRALSASPSPRALLAGLAGLALVAGLTAVAPGLSTPAAVPVTGEPAPGLESYDRTIARLLEKWRIPGASLAVVKDGRLVLAHGYGWADRDARRPVQPHSLFRIASLSKSLTAAAILQLAEAGRLRLDDSALALVPWRASSPPSTADRTAARS